MKVRVGGVKISHNQRYREGTCTKMSHERDLTANMNQQVTWSNQLQVKATSSQRCLNTFVIVTAHKQVCANLNSNYRNLGTKHIMQTADVKHVRKKRQQKCTNNTFQSVIKQYKNQICYKRFQKKQLKYLLKLHCYSRCAFLFAKNAWTNIFTHIIHAAYQCNFRHVPFKEPRRRWRKEQERTKPNNGQWERPRDNNREQKTTRDKTRRRISRKPKATVFWYTDIAIQGHLLHHTTFTTKHFYTRHHWQLLH